MGVLLGAALLALGMGGCDVKGTQTDQDAQGEPLRVVSSNIDTMQLRADGIIEIKFNRLLLPASVTRQSVSVRNASGSIEMSPVVTYDPVLQVVRVAAQGNAGAWLTPNQPYKVVLGVPQDGAPFDFVLRAIDGSTLEKPTELPFIAQPPTFLSRRPAIDFCPDVYLTFVKYCIGCHAADQKPYESLLLDTAEGIRRTAVGHLAQETNTGGNSDKPGPASRVFGIDMPTVDPGNPGNSYLIYKLLLLDESRPMPLTCNGYRPENPILDGGALLSVYERGRLANFVIGQPMPPTPTLPKPSLDEIERLSEWIAQGARVEECEACVPPKMTTDSGVPEGGTDASMDSSTTDAADAGPTDASGG